MRRSFTSGMAGLCLVAGLGVWACSGSEVTSVDKSPATVWTEFILAVNDRDTAAIEALLAPTVEWTWDSSLLALHRFASGRDDVAAGIHDLIRRGVTLDSTVVETVGATLTAETMFFEPGLADLLGGQTLLQRDVVIVGNGMIESWLSTADRVVAVGE